MSLLIDLRLTGENKQLAANVVGEAVLAPRNSDLGEEKRDVAKSDLHLVVLRSVMVRDRDT